MITISPARSIRPRLTLAVGVTALLCGGLAGCSSSGSPTATPVPNGQPAGASRTSPPPVGPASGSPVAAGGAACGLVTASEVTTAIGKPMAAGHGAGDICVFSGSAEPSLFVYVQIYPDTSAMAVPKQNESGGEHLTGLGDDAFWTAAGTLFVQKGTRGFGFAIPSLSLTSQNAPPAIVTLATEALARF